VASVAGANGAAKEVAVFDIADCGPRNRFVVRGNDGVPLIVHNCGSTRAEDDVVDTPPKHRLLALREVIESAGSKVIVFVPFRAPLEMIAGLLRKAYSVEVIHGGVARQDRDRIFSAFQERKDPHILVAQPAAMSHGLTLTAASCIVWFAPTNRSDVYEQANGRITRPGQTRNQLIVHLEGTKLEQRMYERLQQKATMQGVLLGLFK
jgi:SNF2 family DNA or RNA helicase